ncbi:MAG TPA: 50S ribosomal protein L17 [Acidimicrobiia bacterium]|nr:50S ribosomal protein L17 [Acidimicrobiia bacterium]
MPQPKKGPRLGGSPAHHHLILRNLAQELLWEGKITTTVTRAKLVRPLAERLITKARTGTVHARRQVLAEIENREVVTRLFDEVAPRYAGRPGGYTRIVRVGPRRGDGAEMAVIELI